MDDHVRTLAWTRRLRGASSFAGCGASRSLKDRQHPDPPRTVLGLVVGDLTATHRNQGSRMQGVHERDKK